MFDLPKGITVEQEIDVKEGVIQPFDYGVISTWVGKRKTPAGHRIVRAGRIVGYLAESEKASEQRVRPRHAQRPVDSSADGRASGTHEGAA